MKFVVTTFLKKKKKKKIIYEPTQYLQINAYTHKSLYSKSVHSFKSFVNCIFKDECSMYISIDNHVKFYNNC